MPYLPKAKRPGYLPKRNGNARSHSVHKKAKWRRTSERQRRLVPECEVCKHLHGIGRYDDATHADHIISLSKGGAPYHTDNLMTICAKHHGRKSSMEARGYLPEHRPTLAGLIPTDKEQVIRDVIAGAVEGETDPIGGVIP